MTLNLPARKVKKRDTGRTQILDKGIGCSSLRDQLEVCGDYIDLAKLGWGTAIVSKKVEEKIRVYSSHDIEVSLGGTLFELFFIQNKVDEYIALLQSYGIKAMEISDGVVDISREEKLRQIEKFKKHFQVFSEIGSKDVKFVTPPSSWVKWIKEELSAGADYVILEGRESGTAGLYRESGEIRMGLVNEIIESGINPHMLIFEAPQKSQQVWFIEQFGANVNFANISLEDVIGLETLRQGLRADTLLKFHALNKQ